MRWLYVAVIAVASVALAGCGTEAPSPPPAANETAASEQESTSEQGEVFQDDFESGQADDWSASGEESQADQGAGETAEAE